MFRKCSVEGCNNKHHAKGLCMNHYWGLKNYGKKRKEKRAKNFKEARGWT